MDRLLHDDKRLHYMGQNNSVHLCCLLNFVKKTDIQQFGIFCENFRSRCFSLSWMNQKAYKLYRNVPCLKNTSLKSFFVCYFAAQHPNMSQCQGNDFIILVLLTGFEFLF